MSRTTWRLFAFSCIAIGLYPLAYVLAREQMGLLRTKPDWLLTDWLWNVGLYTHILFGGVALLVGWAQFSRRWRVHHPHWHRTLGKVYLVAAMLGGVAGVGIGLWATGGPVAKTGFVSLGLIWLYTTGRAFLHIRQGHVAAHQRLMIYSFAACFGAVTLRIWLPLLVWMHDGAFLPAYRMVAWVSWVPNLLVAWWIVRRLLPGGEAMKRLAPK